MQTSTLSRFAPPVLAFMFLCFADASARAQDFAQWSKLVSFRPDPKMQEKMQEAPPNEAGARPHFLKIERARGNLVLHSASLVVTKMPAVEGRALSMSAFARYLRVHLPEFVDESKGSFVFAKDAKKEEWESNEPQGHQITWIDKQHNTETPFILSDSSSDRWVLSAISTSKEVQPHLMSGAVQVSVTSAAPLEGCIVQVRGAVRPTAAATNADEWNLVERFAGLWLHVLDRTRQWVKTHDGDSIPELLPPTATVVPWSTVDKALHQPVNPWVGIEGTWVSSDKRFRLEFQGESVCDFIETNKAGKEMRMTCPVTRGEGEKVEYVIERPNDNDDLLTFYEFNPAVRTAIKDKKPEPSKLVLSRNSKGKLIGQWYGLAISRDVYGNLQEIKPPTKSSARMYEFSPVGD